MNGPRIVYSAAAGCQTSGFSRYVLFAWKPRRHLAQRFVASLRADPTFPKQIQTRDLLFFWLRIRGALPYERRIAAAAWRSYAEACRAEQAA